MVSTNITYKNVDDNQQHFRSRFIRPCIYINILDIDLETYYPIMLKKQKQNSL